MSTACSPVPRPASGSESSWQGQLQLVYGCGSAGTQVQHCRTQAPLKVQRPFYPEGPGVCHSVILHTAGGVVGGDRLSLGVQMCPKSHAVVTTAAANKIYRSNRLEARQEIAVQVAAGAVLEWLPQETIVFNQAIYRQDLRVELEPGASWLGWEITRFGRSARGEIFQAGNWRSQTQVWQQGRPLWIDRQWLPGNPSIWNSPHGLAGCPVVGSFAWVGEPVTAELIAEARTVGDPGILGVTRLQQGLLCRYRGHSSAEARQWFTQIWNLVRLAACARPACPPRVWQTFS